VPLDPSLRGSRTGAKAGFDLTLGAAAHQNANEQIPEPPLVTAQPQQTVRQALTQGPRSFLELICATGSRDGHDVLLALDAIRRDSGLRRREDGRYQLGA
jgi:hypothetical protein